MPWRGPQKSGDPLIRFDQRCLKAYLVVPKIALGRFHVKVHDQTSIWHIFRYAKYRLAKFFPLKACWNLLFADSGAVLPCSTVWLQHSW